MKIIVNLRREAAITYHDVLVKPFLVMGSTVTVHRFVSQLGVWKPESQPPSIMSLFF